MVVGFNVETNMGDVEVVGHLLGEGEGVAGCGVEAGGVE